MLYLSYRQTIAAYPNGGGAYTVAKENLGPHAGLLAAAALMIDYVLNVAVGISAGVGALVSPFPALHPYTLLALPGRPRPDHARESARHGRSRGWSSRCRPTSSSASFLALLGIGVVAACSPAGIRSRWCRPPPLAAAAAAVGAWLLMRAFASGCTAMTGVEAVSNGVGAFREPAVEKAHRTLTVIVVSLGVLLAGIACLAHAYGIGAMDQTKPGYQSVLSQLAAAVVGRGVFYYVAIGSLLAVLRLSANTSFVGFPRLCRLVAPGRLPAAPLRRRRPAAGVLGRHRLPGR